MRCILHSFMQKYKIFLYFCINYIVKLKNVYFFNLSLKSFNNSNKMINGLEFLFSIK